jgi:hypothetical protein
MDYGRKGALANLAAFARDAAISRKAVYAQNDAKHANSAECN